MSRPVEIVVSQCDCYDDHHMMRFELWTFIASPPDFFVSVQLNPLVPWWKRLWYALLYILGRRSRYSWSHWDTGSISLDAAKALLPLLGRFISESQSAASGTTTGTGGLVFSAGNLPP